MVHFMNIHFFNPFSLARALPQVLCDDFAFTSSPNAPPVDMPKPPKEDLFILPDEYKSCVRQKRSLLKSHRNEELNVETLVVVDKKMMQNHGHENITTYVLTVLNMVGSSCSLSRVCDSASCGCSMCVCLPLLLVDLCFILKKYFIHDSSFTFTMLQSEEPFSILQRIKFGG